MRELTILVPAVLRAAGGDEVDFVLYGERGLRAFEVEMTQTVRSEDLGPLLRFREDYPSAPRPFFEARRPTAVCRGLGHRTRAPPDRPQDGRVRPGAMTPNSPPASWASPSS